MNLLDLLDKDLGEKLRDGIAVALAVVTVIVAVLQAIVDNVGILPQWQEVGAIAIWLQGAITFLGRFTAIGDQIQN